MTVGRVGEEGGAAGNMGWDIHAVIEYRPLRAGLEAAFGAENVRLVFWLDS